VDTRRVLWVYIPEVPNRAEAWRIIRSTGARGIVNIIAFLKPDTGMPDGTEEEEERGE
jgi:hypothetical protein